MAVFRVNKTENYTVMSNFHLREKNMSLEAKGLLSLMLSLPDNWDYSIDGLRAICREGRDAIKKALTELKHYGYIVIDKVNDSGSGKFEYIYNIYEKPRKPIDGKPVTGNPSTVKPATVKPATVKPPQLNTNIQNTKKQNTDILNTNVLGNDTTFSPPTLNQIQKYCQERHNEIDPERFFDFYEARGWMMGNSPMKDWKAAIRNWERSNKSQSAKQTDESSGFDMDRYMKMVDRLWGNEKPPPE